MSIEKKRKINKSAYRNIYKGTENRYRKEWNDTMKIILLFFFVWFLFTVILREMRFGVYSPNDLNGMVDEEQV